jgi:hypothetical protein
MALTTGFLHECFALPRIFARGLMNKKLKQLLSEL